jgi:hypothetical protein
VVLELSSVLVKSVADWHAQEEEEEEEDDGLACAGSASTAAAEVAPLWWKRLPRAFDPLRNYPCTAFDFINTAHMGK